MGGQLAARLLLTAFGLSLVCAGIEISIRLAGVDLHPDPLLRYHRRLGWTLETDLSVRAAARVEMDGVNHLGFRFAEVPVHKSPHGRRVLILGDSFSEAPGIPYAKSFPSLLEESLDASEAWEVINLAVRDWGTAQQLLALREIGLDYDPDLVLLQVFPANDFCNNSLELADTCSLSDHFRPYFRGGQALRVDYVDGWRARVTTYSRAYGYLDYLLRPRIGEGITDPRLLVRLMKTQSRKAGLPVLSKQVAMLRPRYQTPLVKRILKETREMMISLKKELSARKIPLAVAVVPSPDTMPPRWEQNQTPEKALLIRTGATDLVESWFRELDVPVISLRSLIESSQNPATDFFGADQHLSQFGHAQAAAWIQSKLSQSGLLGTSPNSNR